MVLAHPGLDLDNAGMQAELLRKHTVTETVVELDLALDRPVAYRPGQFARVDIAPGQWRDYTIIDLHAHRVRFLVDTGPGGAGARFAAALQPGDTVNMRIPMGEFTLRDTPRPKVMVATGTGLAPFIAMATDAVRRHLPLELEVIFGCRRAEDDLAGRYLSPRQANPRLSLTVCLSAEPARDGYRAGYVTEALEARGPLREDAEYYVCGGTGMVEDVTALLQRRGARHIYTEPY